MAGNSCNRRDTSLKTYSKRVNKTIGDPPCKKIRKGSGSTINLLLPVSQRPALFEIDSNHVSNIAEVLPVKQRQSNNPRLSNSSSPVPHRDVLLKVEACHINRSVGKLSPKKTRRNDKGGASLTSQSGASSQDSLQPFSTHSNKSLGDPLPKKRRHKAAPDINFTPQTKKVKRSSIENYFKPLPSSSSPSTAQPTNIFSDNLEVASAPSSPPSSPPSLPLSGSDSPPKYLKISRKRPRRLTTKPLLLPVATMVSNFQYEEEDNDNLSLAEVVGNMDDSARAELAEVMQDREERLCMEKYSAFGSAFPANLSTHFSAENNSTLTRATPNTSAISNTSGAASLVAQPGPSKINDQPSAPIAIPARKGKPKPVSFQQLQLASGDSVIILCKDCGMVYNRTLEKEKREHDIFHRDCTRGRKPKKSVPGTVLMEKTGDDCLVHRIQVLDRQGSCEMKMYFEDALAISMMGGLGGTAPEQSELWSEIKNPSYPNDPVKVPRYKIYIYTIALDIIAVILAERISVGGAYYSGPITHDEFGECSGLEGFQEYVSRDSVYDVFVSIDRIWTHKDYRLKGYASELVDYIRKDFVNHIELEKYQIAFSLPTPSGKEFAAKYCENSFPDCEFLVNLDDARVVIENGKLKQLY